MVRETRIGADGTLEPKGFSAETIALKAAEGLFRLVEDSGLMVSKQGEVYHLSGRSKSFGWVIGGEGLISGDWLAAVKSERAKYEGRGCKIDLYRESVKSQTPGLSCAGFRYSQPKEVLT